MTPWAVRTAQSTVPAEQPIERGLGAPSVSITIRSAGHSLAVLVTLKAMREPSGARRGDR